MQRFISKLIGAFSGSKTNKPTKPRRHARPSLETLEARSLMSVSPMLAPLAYHYPTDPCAVAVVHPGAQVTLNPQPLPPGNMLHIGGWGY